MKLHKFPIIAAAILLGLSVSGMAHGGGGGRGGFGGGGRGGFVGGGARSFGGARGVIAGPRGFVAGGPRGFVAGRNFGPNRFVGPRFNHPGRFNRGFNRGVNNVVVYGGGYGYPNYYGGYAYPNYNVNPYPVYPTAPITYSGDITPEYVGSCNLPAVARVNGDLVANVQRVLKSKGFYNGPIDGQAGPGTRKAIRAYDAAAGLPVTGMIDTTLLSSMRLL